MICVCVCVYGLFTEANYHLRVSTDKNELELEARKKSAEARMFCSALRVRQRRIEVASVDCHVKWE